jgi:hypothetical protein
LATTRNVRSVKILEVIVGRVINLEGVGKERKQLTRAIVLALRELMQQSETNAQTKDLAAFISLSLEAIHQTIDESVAAWEKRGYWLKADRFRLEWAWSEQLGSRMRKALMAEDWPTVAVTAAQVAEKLNGVKLPQRNRLGSPWEGAWERLLGKGNGGR